MARHLSQGFHLGAIGGQHYTPESPPLLSFFISFIRPTPALISPGKRQISVPGGGSTLAYYHPSSVPSRRVVPCSCCEIAISQVIRCGSLPAALYGLVAYSVARRTHEIGIRMAIGADRADVLRMVLKQGLRLSLLGSVIGGVISLATSRLLMAGLVGLGKPNPATYFAVPALLLIVTLAASYLPAYRASRVNPMTALRYE